MKENNKYFREKDGLLITAWGDVYTYNYNNKGIFRKLKQSLNKDGYPMVFVRRKGKYVHRLVAEAFLPNPENKPEVDHISCNRLDCRVHNLRWVTRHENVMNPITRRNLSKAMTNGPCAKKIYQYTIDGELIREWPSLMEVGRELGYSIGNISECCLGKRKSAYGFIWSYSPLS